MNTTIEELKRLIRHGIAPLVAYLVTAGYLPEKFEGDIVEIAVIVIAFVLAYIMSLMRRKREET